MSDVKGKKKKCGHFCANHFGICCRCINPSNDMVYMRWKMHCKICRGVLIKHPDGIRTQRCPRCKKVSVTYNKGYPVLAPMVTCGNCAKNDPSLKEWPEPQKLQKFQNAESETKYSLDSNKRCAKF